jgi:hypothetical protein
MAKVSDGLAKLERELRLAERSETQHSVIQVLNIAALVASPCDAAIIVGAMEDLTGLGRRRGRQRSLSVRLGAVMAAFQE